MEKYLKILKECSLFKNIDDNELLKTLSCLSGKVSKVRKNDCIFSEGDSATHVGIVLSGEIQIIQDDYYGNRNILTLVEPSELFGESFACANIEFLPVSAVATCESEVLLIDCHRILTVCSNTCKFHNTLIHNLLQILATKNLLLNQKIAFTSKRTTKEKLMAYLLSQAKKNHSSTFTIPYDRQALADYLGVERSAMSAEISKLCKEGVIRTKKHWFEIL